MNTEYFASTINSILDDGGKQVPRWVLIKASGCETQGGDLSELACILIKWQKAGWIRVLVNLENAEDQDPVVEILGYVRWR